MIATQEKPKRGRPKKTPAPAPPLPVSPHDRITANRPLVYHHVGKVLQRDSLRGRIDYEEAVSIGFLVLVKCAKHFDPARGFAFSTYCTNAIEYELWKYVQRDGTCIRVPHNGRDDSCKQAAERARTVSRLPADLGEVASGRVYDQSPDLRLDIETALAHLRDRELYIVIRFFGLSGWQPLTLEDIGKQLGITKELVRQIKFKALRRLEARMRGLWGNG